MNKYQEALNSIDEKTTETIDYCLGPAAILRYCGDEVDILQELVDKATPKKPIKNKLGKFPFLINFLELKLPILAQIVVMHC